MRRTRLQCFCLDSASDHTAATTCTAKCGRFACVVQHTEQKITAATCQAQGPLELLLSTLRTFFTQLLLQNSRQYRLLHACMHAQRKLYSQVGFISCDQENGSSWQPKDMPFLHAMRLVCNVAWNTHHQQARLGSSAKCGAAV